MGARSSGAGGSSRARSRYEAAVSGAPRSAASLAACAEGGRRGGAADPMGVQEMERQPVGGFTLRTEDLGRPRVGDRSLTTAHPLHDGSREDRVFEAQLLVGREDRGFTQRVGERRGVPQVQSGEPRHVTKRSAVPEHSERLGERSSAVRKVSELPVEDTTNRIETEGTHPSCCLVGRLDTLGGQAKR